LVERCLPGGFYFVETLAAVYGLIAAGLEWNFSAFTALAAGNRKHLACGTITVVAVGLACLTASRAAFGFVSVAFRLEKFLVLYAKGKRGAAIGTLDRLVFKNHWMASSLND
jgi:hypothetical protein